MKTMKLKHSNITDLNSDMSTAAKKPSDSLTINYFHDFLVHFYFIHFLHVFFHMFDYL